MLALWRTRPLFKFQPYRRITPCPRPRFYLRVRRIGSVTISGEGGYRQRAFLFVACVRRAYYGSL